MTKKILSLFLCVCMVATLFSAVLMNDAVTVQAATEQKANAPEVLFYQNFEDIENNTGGTIASKVGTTAGTVEMVTENGNTYAKYSPDASGNFNTWLVDGIDDLGTEDWVFEFDIKCEVQGSGLGLVFWASDAETVKTHKGGANIRSWADGIDGWRRMRYSHTDNNGVYTSIDYRKDLENGGEWHPFNNKVSKYYIHTWAPFTSGFATAVPENGCGAFMFHMTSASWALPEQYTGNFEDTVWCVDNIVIYKKGTFVKDVQFRDESGMVVSEIPDGEVETEIAFENQDGINSAEVVMTAYDKDGKMVKRASETKSISGEFLDIRMTMDTSDVYEKLDGGRIEASLRTADGEPLSGTFGILGDAKADAENLGNADLGNDGSKKTYSITNLNRESVAETVTVSGEHSSGKSAVIAVKAMGKTSGKLVYDGQFATDEDGTFARSIAFDSELLADNDSEVTVTLWGADTTSKTFDIPVAKNWNDIVSEFDGISDSGSAEAFYAKYEDNLKCTKAGVEDFVGANISVGSDYETIAFLKNLNIYEEMTAAEVVAEANSLAESLGLIESFMEDFENAKSLETTEEKATAIKNLIEETEILDFPTEGVSNLQKIYEEMTACDAETFMAFYGDYMVYYENQKNAEESVVPAFVSVENGEGLKKFFADNISILGIDTETYSQNDYAVMFGVYAEKGYDTLVTYEQVNGAIIFLDNYINEYNRFIADITDAATVQKDAEKVRDILGAEYQYIVLELADNGTVVKKDGIYKRLIDMDCASIEAVEGAYALAVEAQLAYEISVKDAYITIMDETALKAFFVDFGGVLEVEKPENLTVYLEVYNRFMPTATTYAETAEQVKAHIEKYTTAMTFIGDVNTKAKDGDWSGVKALYEGDVCSELIGMDTETPLVTDVYSMYKRIMATAPFASLAEVKSAFEEAYSAQAEYEKYSGAYETNEEQYFFDDSAWNFSVNANVIRVSGKVNGKKEHNLTLYVEDGTNPAVFFRQYLTQGDGSFDITFILNPDFYNADGQGTLRIGGENINVYKFASFELYSEEELEDIVDDFLGISGEADIKEFFGTWGEVLGMEVDVTDKGEIEALDFAYKKAKAEGAFDDIEIIDDVILGTKDGKGAVVLMETMEAIVNCLEELTKAANEKYGSGIGRWKGIKEQVQLAIENEWINPDVKGKVSSESSLYLKMAGVEYDSLSKVESEYEKAYSKQKDEEADKGGKGGGGASSGGGGSGKNILSGNMGNEPASEGKDENIQSEAYPSEPFVDVTEQYSWAKTSIDGLRRYGLVKGDGNGTYRPGDSISREEFLTILLNVFEVEMKADALANFKDVDKNAWYFKTVATAANMGIVNGYADGRFGIGDPITRADMSVMIYRMIEAKGITVDSSETGFMFKDITAIPQYALSAVTMLQQSGIVKGDDYGYFNPQNKLTRAEAAVVFWSVFGKTRNMVNYTWAKTY